MQQDYFLFTETITYLKQVKILRSKSRFIGDEIYHLLEKIIDNLKKHIEYFPANNNHLLSKAIANIFIILKAKDLDYLELWGWDFYFNMVHMYIDCYTNNTNIKPIEFYDIKLDDLIKRPTIPWSLVGEPIINYNYVNNYLKNTNVQYPKKYMFNKRKINPIYYSEPHKNVYFSNKIITTGYKRNLPNKSIARPKYPLMNY